MTSELKRYTESNRAAWNEAMPKHQRAAKAKWDRAFEQPGYVCLGEEEVAALRRMGIRGKAVAHLCCNNGVELLSLKNLGAGTCVGFDISDLAIQEAQERAARSHIDCRYVRTDIYDISAEYHGQFDVVYVSAGALGWLPDLPRFFAQAGAMLRDAGRIFIHEIHPISEMLPFDNGDPDTPDADYLRIIEPYFKVEPYEDHDSLDYVGGTEYTSAATQYWFVHTISDIIMGLVNNGFAIEHFAEYPTDISAGHQRIKAAEAGIPLSLMLVGRKAIAR